MELVYKLIDQSSIAICFVCCAIVLLEKESKNQKYLLMTFLCGLIITIGNAFEFYAHTKEAALVAVKVAYLGKIFIGEFALLFALGFSKVVISPRIIRGMTVYNIILTGLVMNCERHTLFYSSIDYVTMESGRIVLRLARGPAYFAWMAEFEMAVFVYSILVFIQIFRKGKPSRETRIRIGLLIASVSVSVIFGFAFAFTNYGEDFDTTSVAVVVIEIFMLIDVKRFGLLDTMQLAQRRILEDTKDGLVLVDSRREGILFSNQVARDLFPELTGRQKQDVLKLLFAHEEKIFERCGRHYEIRISEIKENKSGEEVQGYLAWIFDMTFINHYTTEMIRMKEASEQANKAKTNFLAHMSHEIRTPMNAIIGYAELALRSSSQGQMENYVKNIRESGQTLLQLINEILDISKIEAGKMELVKVPYQLSAVIGTLQSMIEAQIGRRNITLHVEMQETIPDTIQGDQVKIQEILLNLLNNALKYTKEGSIFLRVFQKDKTSDRIQLRFEVEDTGIGIEEKNFDHVFRQFEQFDRKNNYEIEGTGLGLFIVKKYAELMGGNIFFESQYGKGSKFIVELWQEIGDELPLKPQLGMDIPEDTIRRGHILVVDDNELNRDVAKGIMECLGMEVETADSGVACLEQLKSGKTYDLIFMDHMMPGMEGVEVLHRIRDMGGRYKELPIVVLTANAINGVKEAMLEEGFDAFLTKPLDIGQLKHVLLSYLGEKSSDMKEGVESERFF